MRFKAKPLRSVMYVPGNKPDWMRKAPRYGADALILDLEDSVPDSEKAAARGMVRSMLAELGAAGQTLFVRVNRLQTGLTGEDLEAITCAQLYGVILPKVQSPKDVVEVDVLLKFFERKAGMERHSVCIDPSLETAEGLRQAHDIATASDRVAHMGGSGGKGGDTARAIGFQWTPEGLETLFLKSKVLVDARAAGVPYPLSGGWMDIYNLDGLRALATQLRQLGYTGMHVIHPSHVPVVNQVFTPTRAEIAHWRGLIQAMAERRKAGSAALTYAGDMVDVAHEETARAMLAMVAELGLQTPETDAQGPASQW
ncbi:Citrate lyase subunit beta [Candidatus Entotheonellaceae bacterium PAL068K]